MTSFEDQNETTVADMTREGEAAPRKPKRKPKRAPVTQRDLHQAKRGATVLATVIVQTLNEIHPGFQDCFLARQKEAYYEIRDNYDGRWIGDVTPELDMLSWTRELLTGFDFFTGQGKPFLER